MRSEWSLIFFTLLTQTAVGTFIILAALSNFSIINAEDVLNVDLTLKILYLILAFAGSAMISSFLHLGKPKNAYHALRNIITSWLSREILFVLLFVALAFVYTLFEYENYGTINLRIIFHLVGSVFGLLAVFSMIKLYMLETVPFWKSLNTYIQFFSSTIILGIICFSVVILVDNPIKLEMLNTIGIYKIFLITLLLLITLALSSFLLKLWALSRGGQTEKESLGQILVQSSTLFYNKIIFSIFAILILVYLLLFSEIYYSYYSLIILSVVVILSEITGRYLFYAGYKNIGV